MKRIFYNGNIVTMDPENPRVNAVMIKDDLIYKVGANRDILNLMDGDTEVINLDGQTVVPGFNDGHLHVLEFARELEFTNLLNCKSIKELQDAIREGIEKMPADEEILIAANWNDEDFKEKRFPTKEDLDEVNSEIPIIALRRCMNIAILNTKAIEMFRDSLNKVYDKDGEDGVVTDCTGEYIGLLKGNSAISKVLPLIKKEKIKDLLLRGASVCLSKGLTSVQSDEFISGDMEDVIDVYKTMSENGEMPIRVDLQLRLPDKEALDRFLKLGYKSKEGNKYFRFGPMKIVSDGTLGARTAAMSEDYNDDPGNRGILIYEPEYLKDMVDTACKNGLDVAIHTIGDEALKIVLDIYGEAREKYTDPNLKLIVVHAQITTPELIEKFKDYNIIAAMQPPFVSSDLVIVEDRVGKEKASTSYNWKTFKDKGIHFSGGSDSPVESFDPLLGIFALVNRTTLDGKPEGGWLPEQKLSVEDAVYVYTMDSAYATGEENVKGSITPGKYADMVVLSEDIFTIPPERIKDVTVLETILGGRTVYRVRSK